MKREERYQRRLNNFKWADYVVRKLFNKLYKKTGSAPNLCIGEHKIPKGAESVVKLKKNEEAYITVNIEPIVYDEYISWVPTITNLRIAKNESKEKKKKTA